MSIDVYTTPDEDPFGARPFLQPRRRRSSMLDKWINEQQKLPSCSEEPGSTKLRINPYLAYPDLARAPQRPSQCGSAVTLASYDLVNDEDIPRDVSEATLPSTPISPTHKGFLGTPTSFRSLHISFRSQSPARSAPPTTGTTPITPSRKSFLPMRSSSKQHNRSTSLGMLSPSSTSASPCIPEHSQTPSKWRPSVLGYFSSSSQSSFIPSETLYAPRPSISSNTTATTTTGTSNSIATATDNDARSAKSSSLTGGFRYRQRTHGNSSRITSGSSAENNVFSSSTYSKQSSLRIPLAPKPGHRLANSNTEPLYNDDEEEEDEAGTVPVILKPNAKPEVAFSTTRSNTLSKMSLATLTSKHSKKKRLIVSGIGLNDVRKFEGVKRWCEGFGEVSLIVRMPNGDLHVHFRSADVADTVCRLRAKVYIVGCGSVGVSWTTGNKR